MPDMDGLQATRAIKQTLPMTMVLILSMFEDADVLLEAVRAGAAGYVLKSATERRPPCARSSSGTSGPREHGRQWGNRRRVASSTKPPEPRSEYHGHNLPAIGLQLASTPECIRTLW
jgi:CheY-like chemotaxis protein